MFTTLESANLWFDIFNVSLAVGAFLVLVGTVGTIKTTAIKERYADERVAANEAQAKRAVADSDAAKEGTAKANERIADLSVQAEQLRKDTAEANARAAETEERLQKQRMSRALFFSGVSCRDALRGKPTGRAEVLWQHGVADGEFFAHRIASCLAGDTGAPWWKIERVEAVNDLPHEARTTGVTVIGKSGGFFLFRKPSDALLDLVGSALMAGLDKETGDLTFGIDASMPDDLVRIVIGPKQ
jgi:hypothetical protein